MFTALTAVKFVVSGVVGIGTGKIVSGIVKDHVNPETLIDKVTIAGATWAFGGIAASATKKFTNDAIDEIYNGVNDTIAKMKEAQKLTRINKSESTFEAEGLDQTRFRKEPTTGKWVAISDEDWAENQGIVNDTPPVVS